MVTPELARQLVCKIEELHGLFRIYRGVQGAGSFRVLGFKVLDFALRCFVYAMLGIGKHFRDTQSGAPHPKVSGHLVQQPCERKIHQKRLPQTCYMSLQPQGAAENQRG